VFVEDNDMVSVADSKATTKSRSGKALDKHCLHCNKKISGANYSRHKREHNIVGIGEKGIDY